MPLSDRTRVAVVCSRLYGTHRPAQNYTLNREDPYGLPGALALIVRYWLARSSSRTTGAAAAAAKTRSRWSRWTASPASRPPPPWNCQTRSWPWTRSTSSASPATHWTAADAPAGRSHLWHLRVDDHRLSRTRPQRRPQLTKQLITSLSSGVPRALTELVTLGRTLKKRAADVLACFDRPGTSNGPTEAINGRLDHLRGSALGFRNLTNYIARSLMETGGFRACIECSATS